ncbi:MAG: sialidase family protein [Candidatus Latescibacterota bacterium]
MNPKNAAASRADALLSEEEQGRNAALLTDYDYDQYPEWITGYTGMNLQEISISQHLRAVRTRIGPRGNYKSGLTALSDGTLIASPCRATAEPGKMQIHIYQSKDHGLTWKEIGEEVPLGKEPTLCYLPDGTLLMTAQQLGDAHEDKARLPISRSTDGGRHWTTVHVDTPDLPRNLMVEPDGSVLIVHAQGPAYYRAAFESAGKPFEPSPHLELLRSTDGGCTWQPSPGLIDWDHTDFGEVSCVRLPSGALLASLRGNPPGTLHEGFELTWLTESTDNGKTWCTPWVMSNTAEVHVHLLVLPDGRLLATYSNYHLPYGAFAVVSSDHGRTWTYDQPIQLALSADLYVGWPFSMPLEDGSLLTVYAITSYLSQPPDRTTCEVVRWNLPDCFRGPENGEW